MSSSQSIERRDPGNIPATEPHSGDYGETLPLTWVRYDPTTDSAALVVGRVDGRRQRQLTYRFVDTGCQDPCFSDQGPAWTPDGNHLTFTRVIGPFDPVTGDTVSALQYSERLDGSDLTLLSVPGSYEDNTVRFSPDGRYVVFTRDQTVGGVLHFAIFRMRSDSTHVRRLTPWDLDADRPSVSPARSGPTAGLVSFETHGGAFATQGDVALLPSSCATIAACTRATRPVTHNTGTARTNYAALWSPDGHRLAFVEEVGTNVDVFTIRPDGGGRRQVTHLPVPEYSPAWSY